jgi:hypothetical protein
MYTVNQLIFAAIMFCVFLLQDSTTQFTSPGWRYLKHGKGVGKLNKGGSYVSLVSPDEKDLTVVIETMVHI